MKCSTRFVSLVFFAALVLCTLSASAQDVFLNGVKVNGGLRGQKFSKADVEFDAKGNVRITVEGVQVHEVNAKTGQVATPAPVPKTRYLLVSSQTKPGIAQYSIDVHINKKLAVRIPYTKGQEIKDITEFLVPGANEITITAIKVLEGGRKSLSPNDTVTVMIGEGNIQGAQVTLSRAEISYVRSAADVAHDSKTFTLTTKP